MPFRPMVQDQSGENIAAGMQSAGQSFSRGLAQMAEQMERRREENKREHENGIIAEKIAKNNPEILPMLGMDEFQFRGLSARDKSSTIQGVIASLTLKEQLEQRKSHAEQRQRAARAEDGLEAWIENFSGPSAPAKRADLEVGLAGNGELASGTAGGGSGSPDMLARAIASLHLYPGAVVHPQFDNVLNSLAKFQGRGAAGATPSVFTDPLTGKQVWWDGKSMIPLHEPAEKKPVSSGTAQPFTVNGKVLPGVFIDEQTHGVIHQPPETLMQTLTREESKKKNSEIGLGPDEEVFIMKDGKEAAFNVKTRKGRFLDAK